MLIVVDPGHSGDDLGAVGFGLKEKDLTLKLSILLIERLRNYQVEIISTRDSDINVGLSARANLANNLNADFFYSSENKLTGSLSLKGRGPGLG